MDDTQWGQLAKAAKAACAHAHCPYSGYPVGAAVFTGDGTVASGCNVENASFGLSVCAERTAVFRAIADGARAIVALVLYTPTAEPAMPCGACRQVLAEFGRDVDIRCLCDGPTVAGFTLQELLPRSFSFNPV